MKVFLGFFQNGLGLVLDNCLASRPDRRWHVSQTLPENEFGPARYLSSPKRCVFVIVLRNLGVRYRRIDMEKPMLCGLPMRKPTMFQIQVRHAAKLGKLKYEDFRFSESET